MINFKNNPSNISNSQNISLLPNNSYGSQTNSSFNLQQSPILQILLSFIVSILQQMLARLGEAGNRDETDKPDATSTEDTKTLNNLNDQQDANILFFHSDLLTPTILKEAEEQGLDPYTIEDQDNSGTLSVGDRLLVGNKTNGTVQERTLNEADIRSINGGAVDSGIPNYTNNINTQQDLRIRFHFQNLITPEIIAQAGRDGLIRPYSISDDDRSGDISAGDRLLVGSKINNNFNELILTTADVANINAVGTIDFGNPNPLSNINKQQDANILFLFRDKITPEIIERTKDFAHAYVISDDDNSGSITVGDRLLIGDRIHNDLQEVVLSESDVAGINGGALGTNNS